MIPVLVDTDVVSYAHKSDSRAQAYIPLLQGRLKFLSAMTLAELHLWAESAGWGPERRAQLDQALREYNVVPFDEELCRVWAKVMNMAKRNGRPIDTADAWVAATALHYDIPLITNNPSDYAGVPGLTLLTSP